MVILKRIKPVWKNGNYMTKIALANTRKELHNWRKNNKHKYRKVFYGSPRKDRKGYYALVGT